MANETTGSPALGGLGARLRAVREEAGFSGADLARALGVGWRQPKVSKIENGRQLPTEQEVKAWAGATGVDAEPLLTLRAKASAEYVGYRERVNNAGGAIARQDDIAALARSCTFLAEYQPALIPGWLQTPSYMREMALDEDDLAADGIAPDELGLVIAAKLRQQAILYEPGRKIVHLVGEAALYTRIRRMTNATLRGQLAHLAETTELPGHTFGVIPFSAASPMPPASGWSLYDRDLVVVESLAGSLQITEPGTVARYARWLDRLREVAVTGAAAAQLCRQIAASLGPE